MIGNEEFSLKEYEAETEYQDSMKHRLMEFSEVEFVYLYDFGDYWSESFP